MCDCTVRPVLSVFGSAFIGESDGSASCYTHRRTRTKKKKKKKATKKKKERNTSCSPPAPSSGWHYNRLAHVKSASNTSSLSSQHRRTMFGSRRPARAHAEEEDSVGPVLYCRCRGGQSTWDDGVDADGSVASQSEAEALLTPVDSNDPGKQEVRARITLRPQSWTNLDVMFFCDKVKRDMSSFCRSA